MTDSSAPEATETAATGDEPKQEQAFSQADVDRIVRERIARIEAKYSDYDELKTKAGESLTLEQRLASVEGELTSTKAEALRSRIAGKFGISTEKGAKGEPSDADLFLTGTDEATLAAQAERLAGRVADRKKQGNVAPKEGETTSSGGPDIAVREFASQLFGSAD